MAPRASILENANDVEQASLSVATTAPRSWIVTMARSAGAVMALGFIMGSRRKDLIQKGKFAVRILLICHLQKHELQLVEIYYPFIVLCIKFLQQTSAKAVFLWLSYYRLY